MRSCHCWGSSNNMWDVWIFDLSHDNITTIREALSYQTSWQLVNSFLDDKDALLTANCLVHNTYEPPGTQCQGEHYYMGGMGEITQDSPCCHKLELCSLLLPHVWNIYFPAATSSISSNPFRPKADKRMKIYYECIEYLELESWCVAKRDASSLEVC